MISEFTQYDIGEEELDDMIDSLDEESRLYYKLKDIRLLYDGFRLFKRTLYHKGRVVRCAEPRS